MKEWVRSLIAIGLLVVFIMIAVFVFSDYFTAYGMHDGVKHPSSKNVTLNIRQGEFHYCGYGNISKNTTVCDLVKKNSNLTFNDIDWFIEHLMEMNFTKFDKR